MEGSQEKFSVYVKIPDGHKQIVRQRFKAAPQGGFSLWWSLKQNRGTYMTFLLFFPGFFRHRLKFMIYKTALPS